MTRKQTPATTADSPVGEGWMSIRSWAELMKMPLGTARVYAWRMLRDPDHVADWEAKNVLPNEARSTVLIRRRSRPPHE